MNLIDSSTTTVRMLPVCECGQAISDLRAEINLIPIGNTNYRTL